MDNALLFVHLVGAILFFSGAIVAGIAQLAALRAERPSEIALLLRVARTGVPIVGVGALLTLAFGLWLAGRGGELGDAWVSAALALWVVSMALGGLGGRKLRHARELAERLAAAGDRPSAELRALVADRLSLYASNASFALLAAILVLMVWRPGT